MKTKVYNTFFEKVLSNPYDQQYESLIKQFIALKDPGTKVVSGKQSALNEKTITRSGIEWSISFHRPDSSWGSWWDVFQLHAVRVSDNKMSMYAPALEKFELAGAHKLPQGHPVMKAFMDRVARIRYPQTPEVRQWQEKNIKNFENMIKFIKNYDEKRDKLFEGLQQASTRNPKRI